MKLNLKHSRSTDLCEDGKRIGTSLFLWGQHVGNNMAQISIRLVNLQLLAQISNQVSLFAFVSRYVQFFLDLVSLPNTAYTANKKNRRLFEGPGQDTFFLHSCECAFVRACVYVYVCVRALGEASTYNLQPTYRSVQSTCSSGIRKID